MAAGLTRRGLAALDESARTFGHHRLAQRRGEAELTIARAVAGVGPASGRWWLHGRRGRGSVGPGPPPCGVRAEALVLGAEVRLGRTRPVPGHARGCAGRGARAARDARGGRSTSGSTRRWSPSGGATRRGAPPARGAIRVPSGAPLGVRLRGPGRACGPRRARGRRRTDALKHLRRGLGDLHEWQSSFGSLDLQTMVTGHGRRLAVRGLRVAVASRSPEVLFEWSERARMLASRVQPVRVPRRRGGAWPISHELRALASTEDAVARAARLGRPSCGSGCASGPGSTAARGSTTTRRRWRTSRHELGAARALVAHVVTADEVVALVVTADVGVGASTSARASALDALLGGLLPDLDMAAADLPGLFAGAIRAELRRPARTARRPAAGAARRRCRRPRARAHAVGRAGRRAVDAAAEQSRSPGDRGPVGDLVGCRGPRRRCARASAGFVAGPRVAQAEAETTAAATAWPGATVLHGAEATAAAVSRLAGEVDVLHVSAHGRHSSENPLFSGFELADGPWFGYDIDQLDGRARRRAPLGVRGRSLDAARWRGADRDDRRLAARRRTVRDRVRRGDQRRRRARRTGRGCTAGCPPDSIPPPPWRTALAEVDPDGPPAPLVCFG